VNNTPQNQQFLNFFTIVLKDKALLERLNTALEKKDDQLILNLAQMRGYDFTANELRQGLKHIYSIISKCAVT